MEKILDKNDFLTPREIVKELDKYIVGQNKAKKAVAIALRNRLRRQRLSPELKEEVAPKNIIMIGPTGVGKTEISRRLAKLTNSPFLKVEASKYTEVGYVGRDVESMIRDITELAKNIVKSEKMEEVNDKAKMNAEERILDLLLPPPSSSFKKEPEINGDTVKDDQYLQTKEKFRQYFREGKFNDRFIEIDVQEKNMPMIEIISGNMGMEDIDLNLREMLGNVLPSKKKHRKVKVSEGYNLFVHEEAAKLIDMEKVIKEAISRVEQNGIIFIDEIDKVAGRQSSSGPDISREGVQRDLLPIVEGSTVSTRYGVVKTDHILFIAAGAFNVAKPSDLIPELQGRFPIRVELDSLTKNDFIKILTEPKNALIKQYIALLETEKIIIIFEDSAIEEIAEMAFYVNTKTENIGARRLHTIMEKLLEDISFNAPDCDQKEYIINRDFVRQGLQDIYKDEDLSRYIL